MFFLPVLYLLAKESASTLWLSFFVAELLTILFVVAVAWSSLRRGALGGHSYLFLSKEYFNAGEDVFEKKLLSIADAARAPQELLAFLEVRQPGQEENALLALALEEMGRNIFENNSDQKGLSVSVRAMKDDMGWLLRLRDSGQAFSPSDWLKLHEDSDPTAHIGIRMISRSSTEFAYTNVVGMNNLVVRMGSGEAFVPPVTAAE